MEQGRGLSDNERMLNIINNLEDIREKLIEVNKIYGGLARFETMKKEITEIGWPGICAKYHPDINTDDPAAFEVFTFYKFVYDSMNFGR